MKLNEIFNDLLLEATPTEIYQKYYSDIRYSDFFKIVSSDPQTKIENKEIKKIGKFSKILLNIYKQGNLNFEDLPKATEYLTYVYKHNVPVDASKILNLGDIYDLIKKYSISDTKDFSTILKTLNKDDYTTLFNGEKWMILKPLTEKGACYLGVSTEWCTTWGKYSLDKKNLERTNQFQTYNKTSPLYIIINKNDFNDKYQFHFSTNQYMDRYDKQINSGEFLSKNPEVRNFFFPSFIKDVSESEIEKELNKINVLSFDDYNVVLNKWIKFGNKSELLVSLVNKDKNINNVIKDYMCQYIKFNNTDIIFTVTRLTDDLEAVFEVTNYLENDLSNSYESVRENIYYGNFMWESILEVVFKKQFDHYKKTYENFGFISYYDFKEKYFDEFINNETIQNEYKDKLADNTIPNYEEAVKDELNKIKKYIYVERGYGREFNVEIDYISFLKYIVKNKIDKIENNLDKIFEGYIYDNDVSLSYEGIEYEWGEVVYDPNKYDTFISAVDDFFEKEMEKLDEEGCKNFRQELKTIIEKVFNGQNFIDNEIVSIVIPKYLVNCDDGTIFIKYLNKQTGKKYEGNVKIENLPSYALNYKLMESYINFKKRL